MLKMSSQDFSSNGVSLNNSEMFGTYLKDLNEFCNQYMLMYPNANNTQINRTLNSNYNHRTSSVIDTSRSENKMNDAFASPPTSLEQGSWLSGEVAKIAFSQPFCEVCQNVFSNKAYLRRHLVHHHGINHYSKISNVGLDTFCILCYRQLSDKQAFIDHYMKLHGRNWPSSNFQRKIKAKDPNITISTKRSKYEGKRANAVHHTEIGAKKYNGERNCDLCPQVFGSVYALKKHKINQHLVNYGSDEWNGMSKPPKHFYPDRNSQRLVDSFIKAPSNNQIGMMRKHIAMRKNTNLSFHSTPNPLVDSTDSRLQGIHSRFNEQRSLCQLPKLPKLIPISGINSHSDSTPNDHENLIEKDKNNYSNFCSPCQLEFSSRFFLNMHVQYKHGGGFNHSTEVESIINNNESALSGKKSYKSNVENVRFVNQDSKNLAHDLDETACLKSEKPHSIDTSNYLKEVIIPFFKNLPTSNVHVENLDKEERQIYTANQLQLPIVRKLKSECIQNSNKRTPVILVKRIETDDVTKIQGSDTSQGKTVEISPRLYSILANGNSKQGKPCKKVDDYLTNEYEDFDKRCIEQTTIQKLPSKFEQNDDYTIRAVFDSAAELTSSKSVENKVAEDDCKSIYSCSSEEDGLSQMRDKTSDIELENSILEQLKLEAELFENELKIAWNQSVNNRNLQEQKKEEEMNMDLSDDFEEKSNNSYTNIPSTSPDVITAFQKIAHEKNITMKDLNTEYDVKNCSMSINSTKQSEKENATDNNASDVLISSFKQENVSVENEEDKIDSQSSARFKRKKFFQESRSKERKFKISAMNKEIWIGKKPLIGNQFKFQMTTSDRNDGSKSFEKSKKKKVKKVKNINLSCKNNNPTQIEFKGNDSTKNETAFKDNQNKNTFMSPFELSKQLGLLSKPKVHIQACSVSNESVLQSHTLHKIANNQCAPSNNEHEVENAFVFKKQNTKGILKKLRKAQVFVFKLSNGWHKIVIYAKKSLKERTFVLLDPPCSHQQLSSMKELVEFSKKYPKTIQINNLKELNFDLPTEFDARRIEESLRNSGAIDDKSKFQTRHAANNEMISNENGQKDIVRRSYLKRYRGKQLISSPNVKKKRLRKRAKMACEKNNKWLSSFTEDMIMKLERLFYLTPCMPTFTQISQWSVQLSLDEQYVWQWFRSKWNAKLQYEASKTRELKSGEFYNSEDDEVVYEFYPSHELKRFELDFIQDAVLPNKDFVIEYDNAEDDFDGINEELILTSNFDSYDELSNNDSDIIEIN